MKVKEDSENTGLKLSIQTTKIMASGPITHGKQMGKQWKQWQLFFSGLQNQCGRDCSHEIKRHLLPGRKVKVAQWCLTLCDPMDYTVQGTLQARILEWVAFPFSRGSSQPRDRTQVSHIAGRFFTSWATTEAQEYLSEYWKKSYDKPKQCIKKQRYHFANKGLYSQNYVFFSSQLRMWSLEHKGRWAPKN